MFLFKPKKVEEPKAQVESKADIDLEIIMKMNQEFASSLDLDDTLNTALKVIIERINAQAANIFLINEKINKFECIASLNQDYLDEYQLDLKDGVMGKAINQKKCIRVGDVRKDVREIAEFYFDLDNKTNFTTFSVLCSPLIAANNCIGVIHCLNKKTNNKLFQEEDRQLLETLSAPAAFAIRNAKMAKEMIEKNKIQKEVEIVGDIQKTNSEKNLKEYDKIISDAKDKAKKTFNLAKEKIQLDLGKEREKIESELNSEIQDAENEIKDLKKSSPEKISLIAVDTAAEIIQKLIGVEVNKSNVSAIVNEQVKLMKGK
jgi:transcriptional regulator with GAF, ATPase, and Fis domain